MKRRLITIATMTWLAFHGMSGQQNVGIGTTSPVSKLHVSGTSGAGEHIVLIENQDENGSGVKIKIDGNHPLWVQLSDSTGYFIPTVGVPAAVSDAFDATGDAISAYLQSGNAIDLIDIDLSEIGANGGIMEQLELQDLVLGGICKGAAILSNLLNQIAIDSVQFSYGDTIDLGPYSLGLPTLPVGALPADLTNIPSMPLLDTDPLWVNPPPYQVSFPAPIGTQTINPPGFNVSQTYVANAIRKTPYNNSIGTVNSTISSFNTGLESAYDQIVAILDSLNGDTVTFDVPSLVIQIEKAIDLPGFPVLQWLSGLPCPDPNPWDSLSFNFPLFDLSNHSFVDTLSGQNEFITFVDKGDRKLGAIKGQTFSEFLEEYFNKETALDVGSNIVGMISDDGNIPENLLEMSSKVIEFVKAANSLGVSYCSGYGDYAEWLERSDHREEIGYGDIVGVRSGKISLSVTGAEQCMVVSKAPIVLGNAPPPDRVDFGNNVAFMGQVPVKVMGPVQTGDYILANPSTPGYGVAVAEQELDPEHFHLAVGRSWETDLSVGFKYVNAIVGMHDNAWAIPVNRLSSRLSEAEQALNELLVRIERLENGQNSTSQR